MVKTLLIIDSQHNYLLLFSEIKQISYRTKVESDSFSEIKEVTEDLVVEQACWEDVNLSAYSEGGVVVDIKPSKFPWPNSNQFEYRTIKPDFVVIRNITKGLPGHDYSHFIYGLAFAGIPTLNSLESIVWNLERPLMYSGLLSIQRKLGKDKFPVIPQSFYPNWREMRITPEYPLVVKVGHVHAGFGKMLLNKHEDFNDLASILALHNDYCTAEPFVKSAYDVRIQKIGDHYRIYKRTSGNWKTNSGQALLEDMQVTDKYKMWADECSKLFGGMDILAIDVVKSAEGDKEYIIEVNDSAIGLGPQHEEEDLSLLQNLILRRMSEALTAAKGAQTSKDVSDLGLSRKLEVELINTENSKMELERKLKKTENSLKYAIQANQQWKGFTTVHFSKVFGASFSMGLTFGALLTYYLVKYLRR